MAFPTAAAAAGISCPAASSYTVRSLVAAPQVTAPVARSMAASVFAPMIVSEVSRTFSSNDASLTTLNFTCLSLWVNAKSGCR